MIIIIVITVVDRSIWFGINLAIRTVSSQGLYVRISVKPTLTLESLFMLLSFPGSFPSWLPYSVLSTLQAPWQTSLHLGSPLCSPHELSVLFALDALGV